MKLDSLVSMGIMWQGPAFTLQRPEDVITIVSGKAGVASRTPQPAMMTGDMMIVYKAGYSKDQE